MSEMNQLSEQITNLTKLNKQQKEDLKSSSEKEK
jgi:hypothetical protein